MGAAVKAQDIALAAVRAAGFVTDHSQPPTRHPLLMLPGTTWQVSIGPRKTRFWRDDADPTITPEVNIYSTGNLDGIRAGIARAEGLA